MDDWTGSYETIRPRAPKLWLLRISPFGPPNGRYKIWKDLIKLLYFTFFFLDANI